MIRQWMILLAVAFILTGCAGSENASFADGKTLFNQDWEFMIDPARFPDPEQLESAMNHEDWEQVSLPHTPRIEPLIVNDQWQGICWYRKTFPSDPDWNGRKLFLRFEGAMNVAEVWLNGNKKITHLGGYLPFVIDITEDVFKEGINRLYVRLDNEDNPFTGPKPLNILDFNMYGGLYRDVFLISKHLIHITDEQFAEKPAGGGIFVTYPDISDKQAVISVQTHIMNSGNQSAGIKVMQTLKLDGKTVVSGSEIFSIDPESDLEVSQELVVSDPCLWSPEMPHLYTLETKLMQRGRVLDSEITRIGIRKFEFHGNKLFINGEETFLRGVNRHQEYPYIGYALSNNAQYRDAVKIKEAGFDYVRLSHYPHSKAFMNACDELGIVTVDAIPGWQYFSGDKKFQDHVLQTARDMIRRDRNHSSVLAWEVSLNESWMPEPFIDSLVRIANEEYPGENCYTAGWQKYGYDIYLQARQHRIGHPENCPDKPYIVSEYGDWEYYAMNAGLNQDNWDDLLEEERSSRQLLGSGERRLLQQALNIQEAHNDNFNTPAVADGYWVMYDYNRGYADDLESSGVMSIFRLPKFSYYFFRSQRNHDERVMGELSGPIVFIASYRDEKSPMDLRIFSNCDEVELFFNDRSLGTQCPDRNQISNHLNHPPFTFLNVSTGPGKYVAVGKTDGKEVARHEMITAGEPVGIILEADLSNRDLESGCKDVIFVHATVVDQDEQPVHGYDLPVQFEISGDGRVIGNSSITPEAGIASILLMAGDHPGEITIRANSVNMISKPFKVQVYENCHLP